MATTGDYILVCFLDEEPIGKRWQRSRNSWPLHITLVPWFNLTQPATLVKQLRAIASQLRPFMVTFDKAESFNEHTMVTLLREQQDVMVLHENLLQALGRLNAHLTSGAWIHDNFKAHVTHHRGMHIPQGGEALRISKISLVELAPMNYCKLIQQFELGAAI
jgi:2'-5' RNA ligase